MGYTDGYKLNEGTGDVLGYGTMRKLCFNTPQHSSQTFMPSKHPQHNIHRHYNYRNICIQCDSHTAIKAPDNYQINSKLVWGCHQFLMKMADHNRFQLTRVPGHREIESNEIANQLVHLWDLNQHTASQQELPRWLSRTERRP